MQADYATQIIGSSDHSTHNAISFTEGILDRLENFLSLSLALQDLAHTSPPPPPTPSPHSSTLLPFSSFTEISMDLEAPNL